MIVARSSSVRTWWCAGTLNAAVRWKTVTRSQAGAMVGMSWMPEDPVPITPTRWPLRSTPSWGQSAVCRIWPVKSSRPSMSGRLISDRHPMAMTR